MNRKVTHKLKKILSTKLSQMVDLYTRGKQQIVKTWQVVKTWVRGNLSINGEMAIHGTLLLIFGLIILGFQPTSETPVWGSIPLLNLIPPPPVGFSTVLRIILILLSLILMFALPWIWRVKLAHCLKGWCKTVVLWIMRFLESAIAVFLLWLILTITISTHWYQGLGYCSLLISAAFMMAVFCKWLARKLDNFVKQTQSIYWIIFWFVYMFSWITGFSNVPAESFASLVVFYIGFIWFIIIGIITVRRY